MPRIILSFCLTLLMAILQCFFSQSVFAQTDESDLGEYLGYSYGDDLSFGVNSSLINKETIAQVGKGSELLLDNVLNESDSQLTRPVIKKPDEENSVTNVKYMLLQSF